MRKTNKELAEFYGIKEGDIVEVTLNSGAVFPFKVENLDAIHPLKYEGQLDSRREDLTCIGNREYKIIKPKKKYGETMCDDYENCDKCPLYLLRCDGYDGKNTKWPLYRVLNEICYKVGMKSNNPIYKAFRAELDKEVE